MEAGKKGEDKWKWIVLPSAFANMAVHVSINYNCGVINGALLDTFDTDPVEASWLMAYYCALFAIASPLASAAILLTDCRTCVILSGLLGLVGFASSSLVWSIPVLYLTLGFTGIAQSFSQAGSVLTLSYYFPDNLPLVHGVCLAGSGMGAFIHPVLSQTFLDAYGFHGAMLMLGGLSFHSTVLGMLFRPNSLEIKSKNYVTNREHSKLEVVFSKVIPPAAIFKIPAFLALIPCIFCYSAAFQSMIVLLPSYTRTYVGLSTQEGSVAAMVLGAGSVASRLFAGIAASDENIGEPVLLVGMSGLLSVLSFCGKYVMELHHGAYIFSFFFGFYSGAIMSLGNSMLMEIVGLELSAHAYGLIMFTYGVAGFTGPPIIALLVEVKGSNMMFIICGGISFVMCALALLMTHLRSVSHVTTSIKDLTTIKDMCIDVLEDGENKSWTKDVLLGEINSLKENNAGTKDALLGGSDV